MKIAVFGLGYVGAVSSACLAKAGHSVIGVDPNLTKVELINQGEAPIIEKDVRELIQQTVADGCLRATVDATSAIIESDLSLVCVGTPSASNGSLDLRYVEAVCKDIGSALAGKKNPYHTVVIRSTILPGTMRDVVVPTLEKASKMNAGKDFGLCNNPEFLREGTAVSDYHNPPKTVIGAIDERSAKPLKALYDGLPGSLIITNIETAEMVKYVDNAWHALKVSFANEIGAICKRLHVDSHSVMDIFCQDRKAEYIPELPEAGFRLRRSCLPERPARVDLSSPIGLTSSYRCWNPYLESNRIQIERALEIIVGQDKKRLGILGFSFKAGTDDLRESPIVELSERLIGKGYELRLYDKNVNLAKLVGANREYILKHIPHIAGLMVDTAEQLMEHAEVLIVGNRGPEFADIVSNRSSNQYVVDLVRIGAETSDSPRYEGIAW